MLFCFMLNSFAFYFGALKDTLKLKLSAIFTVQNKYIPLFLQNKLKYKS